MGAEAWNYILKNEVIHMKKLLILMFIGVVVLMGYYDGGDVTVSLFLLLIFAPSIFERKGRRKYAKSGKRIYDCGSGISNEF